MGVPHGRRRRAGWIVQKYIERPLLVGGRKIDIRCFVLLVANPNRNGMVDGYFYREGYVRTSSAPFSLDPDRIKSRDVHLTNGECRRFC